MIDDSGERERKDNNEKFLYRWVLSLYRAAAGNKIIVKGFP
jgi:hypothetical protein